MARLSDEGQPGAYTVPGTPVPARLFLSLPLPVLSLLLFPFSSSPPQAWRSTTSSLFFVPAPRCVQSSLPKNHEEVNIGHCKTTHGNLERNSISNLMLIENGREIHFSWLPLFQWIVLGRIFGQAQWSGYLYDIKLWRIWENVTSDLNFQNKTSLKWLEGSVDGVSFFSTLYMSDHHLHFYHRFDFEMEILFGRSISSIASAMYDVKKYLPATDFNHLFGL